MVGGPEEGMGLYAVAVALAGLGIVVIVGICIAGVVAGGCVPEGDASFASTITNDVFSFCERFTGLGSTGTGHETDEAAEFNLLINDSIYFTWDTRSFEVDGPFAITYKIRAYDDTIFDSFMRVTVTDGATGRVLLEDGFRRQYDGDREKNLEIPHEGPLQIDLYGNRVKADILIYAGQ